MPQQSQASPTHCKPSRDLLDSSPQLYLLGELGPDLTTGRAGWLTRWHRIVCITLFFPGQFQICVHNMCFPHRCLWHSALPKLLQTAWGTYSGNTSGISLHQQKNPAQQPTCYFSSSVLAGLPLWDLTPQAWLAVPLACSSDQEEVGRDVLSIRSAPTLPALPVPWNSSRR